MVDVVSFNTLIKAHLTHNNLSKARGLMEDMKTEGLQPNRVTYNEVLNAVVTLGSRRSDIWEIVKEMKDASIPPNQVTCSILLKTLNARSSETDILLTMDLIESLDEWTGLGVRKAERLEGVGVIFGQKGDVDAEVTGEGAGGGPFEGIRSAGVADFKGRSVWHQDTPGMRKRVIRGSGGFRRVWARVCR